MTSDPTNIYCNKLWACKRGIVQCMHSRTSHTPARMYGIYSTRGRMREIHLDAPNRNKMPSLSEK